MGREPKAAEIERQTGHGDGKINLEHGERKKDKGEVLFSLREPGHWTQITANEHQTISVSGEQDLSRKVAFFMTGRNIPVPAQFSIVFLQKYSSTCSIFTVFLQKYSSTCSIFHSFLTEIFQYLLNFSVFLQKYSSTYSISHSCFTEIFQYLWTPFEKKSLISTFMGYPSRQTPFKNSTSL